MKFSKMIGLCKKAKRVFVYEEYSGETVMQYIGDGNAAYPIFDMPRLDKNGIFAVMDVPEKNKSDYYYICTPIPEDISFEDISFKDSDKTETLVKPLPISIGFAGQLMKPLQTQSGIMFIDERYLKPLSDVYDVLELYERTSDSGKRYIVAKAGFLLQTVIMPISVTAGSPFADELISVAEQLKATAKN